MNVWDLIFIALVALIGVGVGIGLLINSAREAAWITANEAQRQSRMLESMGRAAGWWTW